jgi:hypothetical protein
MTSAKNQPEKPRQDAAEDLPSSPGDNPVEIVPKDIPPDAAAARDATIRPTTSPDPDEREEALLDEAIEETFPASDPIAPPSYDPTLAKRKADKQNEQVKGSKERQ